MLKAVKFTAVLVAVVSTLTASGLSSRAFAASTADAYTDVTTNGAIPLEFNPVCADSATHEAYWEVVNKNQIGIEYAWGNADDSGTIRDAGLGIAPAATDDGASTTYLATTFYDNDNNMTKFDYAASNESIVSRNASNTPCDTESTTPETPATPVTPTDPATTASTTPTATTLPDACTDATDASKLRVIWTGDSQITITTKEALPVCKTVTLYYSTYGMPDGYDGGGFNATAYPQNHLSSYSFTIEAGSYGAWIMNVPSPDYCVNVQADLYYGPHINGIDANGNGYNDNSTVIQSYGHGTQNIASQIFMKNVAQCTPGRGAGIPTQTSTTTTMTTSTPTSLPDTGATDASSNMLSSLITLLFAAGGATLIGARALRK